MKRIDEGLHTHDRGIATPLQGWLLLLIGFALTAVTGYRWGVAALAWVAPIPFLLYARRVRSVKQALILLGVLLGTSAAQVAKIVTPPISYGMVPGFSIPIALSFAVILALTEWIRRRVGETPGLFAFAALAALGDWLSLALTPIGAWGATGNSQVDSLVLLQFASLFGLPGIGFLMGLFQSSLSLLLGSPGPRIRWKPFALAFAAVSLVLVYGAIRLSGTQERTISVAAVVTDLGLDGNGLPTGDALAENTDDLYRKTRAAASRGATLVSWNEAAAVVEPGDEEAFLEQGKTVARELDVDLVLAYGTLVSRSPLLFDNKYAFITREGTVAEIYRKHHPVPGEPSMRGNDPLRAIDRPYGRVAGAICYDYDFPAMARGHAALGADLVAVPSSDWAGIDPVHTLMARARAIEYGLTVLRPVRWASSAVFDGYGRVRAWMPVSEKNDRVMVADAPIGRVTTLYSRIGDWPLSAAGAYVLVVLGLSLRRRPRHPA